MSRLHIARSQDHFRRGMPQFFAQTFDRSGLSSVRPIFVTNGQTSVSDRIASELSPSARKATRLGIVLGIVSGLLVAMVAGSKLISIMQGQSWNAVMVTVMGFLAIFACCVSFVLVSEFVRKIAVRNLTHKIELPYAESDMLVDLKPHRNVGRRHFYQDGTKSNLG